MVKPRHKPTPPSPLKAARLMRGWSIYQVVEAIGISYSTVGRYEAGVAAPPLDVARRFADLYETTVEALWPVEESAA